MKRILPLLVVIITIGFTSWVSVPYFGYPLGGMNQKDISDMYLSAITPAGFTFSIWSLIYLSWIVVWGMIALRKIEISRKESILFSSATGLTALWLIPWHYNIIWLSFAVMLVILSLLLLLFRQTCGASSIFRNTVDLFLGWIIIATLANFSAFLLSLGSTWGKPGDVYFLILFLGIWLIAISYLQCRHRAYVISGVYLWALLWVFMAHTSLEERVAVVIFALVTLKHIWSSYQDKDGYALACEIPKKKSKK
jgi:translocator protein